MKHLIKKEKNILHGTIGWSHNGKDGQYCEAGDTVKIKWQPTAGWGLQELHYTDGGGNVVAIEGGEFVMPDSAVVIGATFKRFFLNDWADEPYNPQPVTPRYLTFTAGAGGANVGFIVFNDGYEIPETYIKPSLQYSIDGGKTWQDYDLQISDDLSEATLIDLGEGENVMFKGVNENLAYYLEDDGDWFRVQTYIEGNVAASGDVTSLLNGVGGDVAMPSHCCINLFRACSGLTTPPNLPSVLIAEFCYSGMFYNCPALTEAPALPATTLAEGCYETMFQGCTALTEAPALPATTLASDCYFSMFQGCTALTEAPALPATTLAEGCYRIMFRNCTALTEAPTLPATTLASDCYGAMFQDCTGITSHDVATLNTSTFVFSNNSSCASLTIHAETPPTIADSTITGLKADCVIYVPAASVDAYKAAQYWSARSSYIQAIP